MVTDQFDDICVSRAHPVSEMNRPDKLCVTCLDGCGGNFDWQKDSLSKTGTAVRIAVVEMKTP